MPTLADHPLERHGSAVLQFSGGMDSLACLYLLRPYWDRLTVLWVNTSAAFPETIARMRMIAQQVPRFMEVMSDQPANLTEHGYPSDVLPAWDMPGVRGLDATREGRAQSPVQCCAANIWFPMVQACRKLNATLIIRGQRNEEAKKGPVRNGHVVDGIEYWLPIEDWSRKEVRDFLTAEKVDIPAHYAYVDSSLDCWSCTAYLPENVGKFRYMKERHPQRHAHVMRVMRGIVATAERDLSFYRQAIG